MESNRAILAPFRLVQPYGRDKGRQATTLGHYPTVDAAFAALDALALQMQRTGASSDAIEVLVVDARGAPVSRPGAQ